MEPLARNWGIRGMGLFHLSITPEFRKKGLGTFLVGESLRHMNQQQSIKMVEAQVGENNAAGISVFHKMGFGTIDTGIVLRKNFAP